MLIRLVTGLDLLNKFLVDPPGKITRTQTIYSAMADWQIMGEIDFSDFYFQIKFQAETERQGEAQLPLHKDSSQHALL